MPKYVVDVDERLKHSVIVWAEDTDEALKKARNMIVNGPDTEYFTESVGLDEANAWVEEIEGDD